MLCLPANNLDTGNHNVPVRAHPLGHDTEDRSETLPAFELLNLAEDWRGLDLVTPIALSESRVTLQTTGKSIDFLLELLILFLTLYSGPTISSPISVLVVDGTLSFSLKTQLLPCVLAGLFFFHAFLVIPACPTIPGVQRLLKQLVPRSLKSQWTGTSTSVAELLVHPLWYCLSRLKQAPIQDTWFAQQLKPSTHWFFKMLQ